MYLLYLFYLWNAHLLCFYFFFFNDTATTEIYTLSLHDALPIYLGDWWSSGPNNLDPTGPDAFLDISNPGQINGLSSFEDRKSTRLNSSHSQISYAVFCLKKKKTYKVSYMQTVCTYTRRMLVKYD